MGTVLDLSAVSDSREHATQQSSLKSSLYELFVPVTFMALATDGVAVHILIGSIGHREAVKPAEADARRMLCIGSAALMCALATLRLCHQQLYTSKHPQVMLQLVAAAALLMCLGLDVSNAVLLGFVAGIVLLQVMAQFSPLAAATLLDSTPLERES